MNIQFYANLLGVEDVRLQDFTPHRKAVPMPAGAFSRSLSSASLASSKAGKGSAGNVVARVGTAMASLLLQISNSTNLDERRNLALSFREKVLDALREAGHSVRAAGSPDKIIVNGKLYDIIRSLNSPGSPVAAQFLPITENDQPNRSASGSISGIVFSVGRANGDLIAKINASSTLDERRQFCAELRDLVIAALRASGHAAEDIGKPDKIVVDGTLYDIIRAANGLGMQTAVQLLNLGPYGNGVLGDPRFAIFSAGAGGGELLSQISDSSVLEERRSLAAQLQGMVVSALRSAGFSAEACESPDKLVLNGVTYDFIRDLNCPGATAQLQAHRVA